MSHLILLRKYKVCHNKCSWEVPVSHQRLRRKSWVASSDVVICIVDIKICWDKAHFISVHDNICLWTQHGWRATPKSAEVLLSGLLAVQALCGCVCPQLHHLALAIRLQTDSIAAKCQIVSQAENHMQKGKYMDVSPWMQDLLPLCWGVDMGAEGRILITNEWGTIIRLNNKL